MKLSVVSDAEGAIRALAVCRVVYDSEPGEAQEVELRARPVANEHGADVASYRSCVVDAPAWMDGKDDRELMDALMQVEQTMRVVFDGERASLREHRPRDALAR